MVHIYNGILLSHKKGQNNAICSNMDETRDSYTKWSKSERERQIPHGITYFWNLMCGTKEPFHRKETHGLGEQSVVATGEGEGVGWIGSLGLIDADYCLWNGLAMRSCCVALGSTSSHLRWNMLMWEKKNVYMYV